MNCKASWFDANEYPRLSIVLSVLVVTLILVPFVLVGLYYWVMSDIGANNPFLEPILALTVGLVAAFALSLPCACAAVLAYRFVMRYWKGKKRIPLNSAS
jgi:hypothetical protein